MENIPFMDKSLQVFEKAIMYTLLTVGMLFVLYQTAILIYQFFLLVQQAFETGDWEEGHGKTFGAVFFNVLLTMEIVETVRIFKHNHKNKIQIILLVGLVAVTRKVLLLDAMHADPISEIALSLMLVALGTGYYLVTRSIQNQ